jgi:hypothetical protein
MKEGSKYQFTHIGFNIFICMCTRTKLKGTHFGGGRAKDINGEKEVFWYHLYHNSPSMFKTGKTELHKKSKLQ